jgi:hypothetical protein
VPGGAPSAEPPPAFAETVEPSAVEAAGAGPIPDLAVDEPAHVSEEPVLVAESADPEAADGVRTDLHVAEPWEGYRGSTAKEVIAELAGRSAAELAVVRLYESTHRARRTVLEAADRELAGR